MGPQLLRHRTLDGGCVYIEGGMPRGYAAYTLLPHGQGRPFSKDRPLSRSKCSAPRHAHPPVSWRRSEPISTPSGVLGRCRGGARAQGSDAARTAARSPALSGYRKADTPGQSRWCSGAKAVTRWIGCRACR